MRTAVGTAPSRPHSSRRPFLISSSHPVPMEAAPINPLRQQLTSAHDVQLWGREEKAAKVTAGRLTSPPGRLAGVTGAAGRQLSAFCRASLGTDHGVHLGMSFKTDFRHERFHFDPICHLQNISTSLYLKGNSQGGSWSI